MSADLFAEFNATPPRETPPPPAPPALTTPWNPAQGQIVASNSSFDYFSPVDVPSQQSRFNSALQKSQPQSQQQQKAQPLPSIGTRQNDDDDGWGDFETAQAAASPEPARTQEDPRQTRMIRASTLDIMTNTLVDVERLPTSPDNLWVQKRGKVAPPVDPNVLFDADDFELQGGEYAGDDDGDDDDDEFGDFEAVQSAPAPAPAPAAAPAAPPKRVISPPSMDLLSLDDTISSPPEPQPAPQKRVPAHLNIQSSTHLNLGATSPQYPHAPKSPSYQQRTPYPDLAIKTPISAEPISIEKEGGSPTPMTVWPTIEDNPLSGKSKDQGDAWTDWDAFPEESASKVGIDSTKPPESWAWDAVDNVRPAPVKPKTKPDDSSMPPPVNVPPPSVILSAFTEIFGKGHALFKPISGQSASIKDRVLSDPKAVEFLEAYILIGTTAARVIAGRKQRWHRDKILAKSMSISAAGSKGMKLAGVDKTQSVREDREAADVVAAWREHVGRLRSAVAAANAAANAAAGGAKASLWVPELSADLQLTTAKMVPTAPKPCVICGLKREERVAKVDVDVEDSFGEWWAEHWGHRACRNFWIEHEQRMRQR